jgi:hypothetical protein
MVFWGMYSLFFDFIAAVVADLSEKGGNEGAFLNL